MFLGQERSQCQIFQNVAAILTYANEDLWGARKAGPPSYPYELFLMKVQTKFDTPAIRTFGARAAIMSA